MAIIPTRTVSGIEVAEIAGDPEGGHIVLFHGFGADLYDLIPLSGVYRKRPRPTWIFPNGPISIPIGPNWMGKAWFHLDIERLQIAIQNKDFDDVANAFPEELQIARKKMDELIDELQIPRSKLLVGGFSQGAVLATDFALHSSSRCSALLIFSGTLTNQKNWTQLASVQSGLPFFQCHGKNDPLLPYSKAQELEKLLIDGGCKGKLFSFEGGHEIPLSAQTHFLRFLEEILDK